MTALIPLILATLFLPQAPANQNSPSPPAAYPIGQGVTAPVLLHETKPNYPPEAMRARIQGVVALECVVMPDGSVGAVRVTRSLDQMFGLDDEAVKSLKQWRFRPGMKDGAPVPVLVMIEMTYSLGARRDDSIPGATVPGASIMPTGGAPALLAWPDAFGDAGEMRPSSAFFQDVLHQPTFDLSFSQPSTWSKVDSSAGITLYADGASGTRAVTISSHPAQFSLTEPVSQSVLDSFTAAATQAGGFLATPRIINAGQVARSGGLWLWFEMAATNGAWSAPPALADRLGSGYGAIHVWSFATTAAGQSISVFCTVVHRAGLSDAEQQEQIRRAGLEFSEILRRIWIQPK